MSDTSGYELEIPFVTVTSKGGPHDDDAYVAGWEMGALDALLEHSRPAFHEQTIRAVNGEQADLVAMRHGYASRLVVAEENPDWSWLELIRLDSRAHHTGGGS